MTLPHGTLTFCFLDAAGPDEASAAPAVMNVLRTEGARAVEDHGGTIVRVDATRVFAVFTAATAAVAAVVRTHAAVDAALAGAAPQRGTDAGDGDGGDEPPRHGALRSGLHTGEAEPHGDDYAALVVHEAARIADAAQRGCVVISDTTRTAMDPPPEGIELRRLGRYRLRDLHEPVVLHAVSAPGLRAVAASVDAVPDEGHNVAPVHTAFIGRATARTQIEEALAAGRVVTLAGPGGVGKTRLASEVARAAVAAFPDGVWLVDVGPAADTDEVAREIADTIGAGGPPGPPPLAALTAALAARQLLLVVDGSEVARQPVAEVIEAVVAAAPMVKVLSTSRVPLGVDGEIIIRLAPFDVPPRNAAAQVLAGYDAVQLFLDRARRTGTHLELDEVTGPDIAAVCGAVDGMPLAIELAAASLRSEMLPALAASLRRPAPGDAAVDPLRLALEHTAAAIGDTGVRLWRRLSVFRGAFTLDRALAVAAFDPLDDIDAIDALEMLVDWSVVAVLDAEPPRYRLLDTIRAFGVGQAGAAGELDDLRRRHLDAHTSVVLALAATGGDALTDEVMVSRTDLRVAVRYVLGRDPARAAGIVGPLLAPWEQTGRLDEAAGWCQQLLGTGVADADPEVRARLLQPVAAVAYSAAWPDAAAHVERSVTAAREAGTPTLVAGAALLMARVVERAGDAAGARQWQDEAARAAEASGDPGLLADALRLEAVDLRRRGDYDAAARVLDRAMELVEPAGMAVQRLVALEAGQLAVWSTRYDDADRHLQRALDLADRLHNETGRASAVRLLGQAAHQRGEFARAEARYRDAAATARRMNRRVHYSVALADVAMVLPPQGRLDEAVALLDEAIALGNGWGRPTDVQSMLITRGLVHIERGALAEADTDLSTGAALSDHSDYRVLALGAQAIVAVLSDDKAAAEGHVHGVLAELSAATSDARAHRHATLVAGDLLELAGDTRAAGELRARSGRAAVAPIAAVRWWRLARAGDGIAGPGGHAWVREQMAAAGRALRDGRDEAPRWG